ncbi:DNA-binding protein [Escherichia coli]|uniref:Rha family transcriptional regulator n=1 Tax=Escherichia coli TaxID=562 RepID=UPI000BDF108C|nr:Rha family transcriptional regulator [Escherichia coli]EFD8980544.1 DNA-binding protein [Escherichia coli]EFK3818129.1 DNA-binding protein [Escherichia coli]EFM3317690.1 DNA-binding protein [Escherichia coli]EGG0617066.1 DNA-binding protein [Escherichia coli]HDJ1166260.1 Rha family transcriptional regulator [Escherichia coli]
MNTAIFTDKASMTSVEIAELVGKRHDNVKRTIETLAKGGVVRSPQIEVSERINNLGVKVQHEHYLFEGEQGKRDSIIVVAQLCPEFTACLVDRWRELEKQIRKPMSQIEMVAAMALEAVRQQRRLEQVEEKVTYVTETVERIKRGTIRDGYAGYRQLVAKTGMSDAKCRNLVNAYQIPTDPHEFMRPDGLLSRRAIVAVEPFMAAFYRVMEEAEPRGTCWYYPKMGVFQVIGWQK